MGFISMNELLQDAREKKYAIPAFDVTNYEMIRTVAEVCEEERSPALFMCLQPDLEGKGLGFMSAMVRQASVAYDIKTCLHLDHATSFDNIVRAIDAGFSSVMVDGSVLPFAENAAITKRVVDYAHSRGISVEAELGHVCDAIAGTGESVLTGGCEENPEDSLTDPDEVVRFIDITGVDALAVAVGTAHGVYRSKPVLRFDRLEQISRVSEKPLVLHGGSGTPDEAIKKAISLGITKINIFSEVLNALNTGLRDKLTSIENMSMWSVYVYENAKIAMREVIRGKIRTFGSNNRL